MEIIKTEGIIIGETNYSESSKILKVLTKDYGLVSIMSKGCRNLKSKLRGVSSKLIFANFQFYYKPNGNSQDAGAYDMLKKFANKYEGASKNDLISAIKKEAEKGRKNGTLSNKDIDNFANMLLPMLNNSQKAELKKIVEELKKM